MALIGNGKLAPGSRVDTSRAELKANGSWNASQFDAAEVIWDSAAQP
jgi:hypothetical protein